MSAKSKEPTGWIGWVGFASFMLLLGGVFALIAGIVGLFKDNIVYSSATNTAWILDYTTWGVIHIFAGVLAILAAASLMTGGMFGRIFAVIVALLSAAANMAFIPIYPIWSILIIAVDILVIFAVTVHGGEMRERE